MHPPKDTLANENRRVNKIANALCVAGYSDETYARKETPHLLFDYQKLVLD
jgi:hypothetical protein